MTTRLVRNKRYTAESIQAMKPVYYQAGSKIDPDVENYELLDWFDGDIYIGPDGWGLEPVFDEAEQ